MADVKSMLSKIQWQGAIIVDDYKYENFDNISSEIAVTDKTTITLLPVKKAESRQDTSVSNDTVYRISVRQYMTKKSSPSFNFMETWNNDEPMPLMTMVGTILKETKGMYRMKLHADTSFKTVNHCMNCGKVITNPVSKFFGMGPECGRHNYVNPFNTEAELNEAVERYKIDYLSKIEWEGWVIKSAITSMEEIEE